MGWLTFIQKFQEIFKPLFGDEMQILHTEKSDVKNNLKITLFLTYHASLIANFMLNSIQKYVKTNLNNQIFLI